MGSFGSINSTSETKAVSTQTPSDAATINLIIVAGNNTVVKWTSAQNSTVNISSGTPSIGDELTLVITNDGILPRVITLGTLLTSIGVITGIVSKDSVIKLVGNGTKFIELSRTVGI